MRPTRFTTVASAVAAVAVVAGGIVPLAVRADAALAGSLLVSGLVGGVFAVYNVYCVRTYGQPRLAAALLTTAFGAWLIVAPLQYGASGFALLAGVQGAGLLTAAFGAYTAIEALELVARGRSLRNVGAERIDVGSEEAPTAAGEDRRRPD